MKTSIRNEYFPVVAVCSIPEDHIYEADIFPIPNFQCLSFLCCVF